MNSIKHIGLIVPDVCTFNIGDLIISKNIEKIIHDIFPNHFQIKIPMYNCTDKKIKEIIRKSEYIFLCGTGILTNQLYHWPVKINDYNKNVILMGLGWNSYENKSMRKKQKKKYNSILSNKFIHSLRDSYTENKIKQELNISTINTTCPSLWNLNIDNIERKKSKNVLFSLHYSKGNSKYSIKMLEMLGKNYEKIYFYAQSPYDYDLLEKVIKKSKLLKAVNIIKPNIISLNQFIKNKNFDYIGQRLHGGVHCLNNGKRAFIFGVDNRAIEIHKDINLPVYNFNDFGIEKIENDINSIFESEINLPIKNINAWLDQFK